MRRTTPVISTFCPTAGGGVVPFGVMTRMVPLFGPWYLACQEGVTRQVRGDRRLEGDGAPNVLIGMGQDPPQSSARSGY